MKIKIAIVIIVLFCAVMAFESSTPSAAPKSGGIFTVSSGDSLKTIGTRLEAEHFIRSHALFSTLVTFWGGEHRISPGDYYFSPQESVVKVAQQIARANHRISPIKITIPEGKTVKEITDLLTEKMPNFPADIFAFSAQPLEGYLFPETYFFYPKTSPDEIVKEMHDMFTLKTSRIFTDESLAGHSEKDIIIMASIIEKEAHGADDRAIISGILWRRLSMGIPLQVDATVAYANSIPETELKKINFSFDSPYNTYIYKGLPPGPISNPGLNAIRAALNPEDTSALYYLHDWHGTIHYAKTYAEHQKNITQFLR